MESYELSSSSSPKNQNLINTSHFCFRTCAHGSLANGKIVPVLQCRTEAGMKCLAVVPGWRENRRAPENQPKGDLAFWDFVVGVLFCKASEILIDGFIPLFLYSSLNSQSAHSSVTRTLSGEHPTNKSIAHTSIFLLKKRSKPSSCPAPN